MYTQQLLERDGAGEEKLRMCVHDHLCVCVSVCVRVYLCVREVLVYCCSNADS